MKKRLLPSTLALALTFAVPATVLLAQSAPPKSAAQLQANPASLPPSILSITGVIPFTETIFLWQSGVMLLALIVISLIIAYATAPGNVADDGEEIDREAAQAGQVKVPPLWKFQMCHGV